MRATTSWDHPVACSKATSPEVAMERVAIAVLWHAGKFLIGRRSPGDFLAGLWEFPGGKIAAGETPSAAAVRECKEETGLDVMVIGTCKECTHCYRSSAKKGEPAEAVPLKLHLSFLACRPLDLTQSITSPFCWVAAEQLSSLEFPAANRAVLAQLIRADFVERFWGDGS